MSHSPQSLKQPRALAATAALALLGLVSFVLPACAGEKSNAAAKPAAAAPATADKNTPVAEVNGKVVTMADLEAMLATQLQQLDRPGDTLQRYAGQGPAQLALAQVELREQLP